MKIGRIEKYAVLSLIAVIFLIAFFILTQFFVKNIFYDMLKKRNPIVHFFLKSQVGIPLGDIQYTSRKINWAEEFPFSEDEAEEVSVQSVNITSSLKDKIKSKFKSIKYSLENYSQKYFILYKKYLESAAFFEKSLGLSIINDYVILPDGYLSAYSNIIDVQDCIDSFDSFNNFLKRKGINFLYVQAPGTICTSDSVNNVLDFSNQNADNLIQALADRNISYLDLRRVLHEQGRNHHNMFFLTDHHWTPESGLWATYTISEYLNNHFNFKINTSIYAPDNYNYEIHDNYFLGSTGRKATLGAAKLESFSYIYPKFEADVSIKIPSRRLDARGDFSVLYWNERRRQLEDTEDPYMKSFYETYAYASNALSLYHNNDVIDGKRILILRDSFSCVVEPFMALGIENVDTIDLRKFDGSLQSYIEQYPPDIVMVLCYTRSITNIDYTTHTSLFDFR